MGNKYKNIECNYRKIDNNKKALYASRKVWTRMEIFR